MSTIKPRLQVLLVEDSGNDAALLEDELEQAGYEPVCHRVETAAAMSAAFERQDWDLVIADYALPRFDGLAALSLVRRRGLDLPFIIVSGVITDEKAVAAMKAGAHDYVMKDNLHRLGPAVQRELREAEVRRARRRADEKLKAESAFRQAIESSVPSGIAVVDLEGRQTYVNPAFCELVGWTEAELVGAKPPFVYWPPEQIDTIAEALGRVTQGEVPVGGTELPFRRRDGEQIDVLLLATPLKDGFGSMTGWVSSVSNITQRKRAERQLAAAEQALRRANDELELRVEQRTAELNTAYANLQSAVAERARLEQELLEITENERRRIGLDLHDDLGQHLSGIVLMTRGLELTLAKRQAPEAQDAARIHSLVQQAMTHTRDVVRDLAALDLKQHDLSSALDTLAAHATEVFEIPCRFKSQGSIPPLEPSVSGQLYKITQEAVTNAIRHGKAKRVEIGLTNGSDRLVLTVLNNGMPFPDLKGREAGMGLRIMNYRASLIGASLEIKAAGARGTLLTCSLPVAKH